MEGVRPSIPGPSTGPANVRFAIRDRDPVTTQYAELRILLVISPERRSEIICQLAPLKARLVFMAPRAKPPIQSARTTPFRSPFLLRTCWSSRLAAYECL